ncbi:hypothetical protein OIU79_030757 [Salix purpurea]|uniref:Uncharacterized protein n=1 Tax=Salix purpurea TaxID=77065 RepID=A0A9Q0VA29_SALPP|nr:hypothetical protein OIU79_030757 [Salix purpurea]
MSHRYRHRRRPLITPRKGGAISACK